MAKKTIKKIAMKKVSQKKNFLRQIRKKFLKKKYILKYGIVLLIVLIFFAIVWVIWISRDLPAPRKLITADNNSNTRIYDRNGVLLYSFYLNENRTYVPLSQIPKYLQEGTIAIEDKNFYINQGFSTIGMARAVKNMFLGGGLQSGSTITQQLVKNV